ncbi:hypothetical protein [Mycobacterium sp. SMC-4]
MDIKDHARVLDDLISAADSLLRKMQLPPAERVGISPERHHQALGGLA